MKNNLTKGTITKTLILFSIPLILSGLLQQLYNWADAFIVGNVNGELALAAIGATTSVSGLLIALITGFTVGTTILVANMFGRGDQQNIKHVLSTFMIVLGIIFSILSILGAIFTKPILLLLNTPSDILMDACQYQQIIFLGIPFIVLYNVYSSVLRGIGDSKTPFLAIIVSAITNIVLDILLVVVLPYGVMGAAIATVISQVLMAVFTIMYSNKKYTILKYKLAKQAIHIDMLKQGLKLSIPTATQASLHSVGNLLLQNFMNGFGTQTVAAITTAYRIDSIIMLPMINIGAGISTITAQNIGAGNPQRAKKGLGVGTILIICVSILLTVAVIFTAGSLISLFGLLDDVVVIGERFFSIIALFYVPYGICVAIKGYLEGIGDVVFSSIASVVSLVIRICLSYRFMGMGSDIIAYAEAFSWIALLIFCIVRLVYILKYKSNKQVALFNTKKTHRTV